jgi:transcriptional regulator with GAF, ATPase, and Fis domain
MVAAQLAVALKNSEYVAKIERQKEQIDELRKRVEAENIVLRAEVRVHTQFKEIIGSSVSLRDTLDCVAKVAPTDASILITGETGTGKELVARAIHELSLRSSGPLICVNCPAIPSDIAESELFGCERGAFTGAVEARPGKFEMAHGGTVFLDEVADLSPNVQVKLLRVLQEREVQRLGSHKVRSIDVRIVSATNRDLKDEIRKGRFREDLYFRLASVPVHVPPLRDRIGDINLLAAFFLKRAATQYQKAITGLSPDALNALASYNWPGNIRELQHVIERAVLLCTSSVLQPEHLSDLAAGAGLPAPATLGAAIREEKLRRVREALFQTGGNQAAAARLLGMSRSNLARLIKRYGIDPVDFTH